MQQQFEALGLPARRWSAVDGRDLDFEGLVLAGELREAAYQRLMLPDEDKIFGMDLTPGALGCALSHMEVWIDIMQRRGRGELDDNDRADVFLVVEDDCSFLPEFNETFFKQRFAEVPEDWEVVFLGGIDAMGLQGELQVAPGVRRIYNGSRETTAYIVNAHGARSALEVCVPLMWQLDTQMTSSYGKVAPFNPEIRYTTKPMSYIFWPPLVVQNKEDFPTDVQKDEHPRFLHGPNGENAYAIVIEPVADFSEPVMAKPPPEILEMLEQYSLVGSWDDWTDFYEFQPCESEDTIVAEVEVPGNLEKVEFQLVRDHDWNQRIFPGEVGDVLIGPSDMAHGNNWQIEVPPLPTLMQVRWDLVGGIPMQWRFFESTFDAMSRDYDLVGSWDSWSGHVPFLLDDGDDATTFTAEVFLLPGEDILFQIVCDGNRTQRLYPSPQGNAVLGPNEDWQAKVWRVAAPADPALLRVRLDPTGKRRIECVLDGSAAA